MINKVIVCGVRRAKELIPIGEIQQAIGRAGRSYHENGEAIIMCSSSDVEYAKKCLYEQSPPIQSELKEIDNIAFHILPWMDMIYDEESFQKWYQRSLASIQNNQIHWKDIFNYLFEMNCIDEEYNLTSFGNLSVKSYYSPIKLNIMKNKLAEVNANNGELNPISISYILSSDYIPTANVDAYELSEYKSSMLSEGYMFENGELIHGFAYYCILTNSIPRWIKHIVSPLREDLSRLFNTLSILAEIEGMKDLSHEIKIYSISAIRRVPMNIAQILNEFKLEKKTSAYELNELGIYTKQDLKDNEENIISYGSKTLKEDLQNQGFLKDLLIKEWRNL
jgi:replicative superfamily II helicase